MLLSKPAFVAVVPLVFSGLASAYNNGLARTPQMGWNTWNTFSCNITESTILSAAQTIKNEGLDKLGYNYVVIDDCWQAAERDPQTKKPVADSTRFPRGLAPVVQEINQLGLKAGIYSSAGVMTCGHHFGSLDYEDIDAQFYADTGFEYLKYDNCFNQGREGTPELSFDRFNKMSQALNKTGKPILYSMCNWGVDGPWNFATEIANSFRISGDVYSAFDRYDSRCPCTDVTDCKLPGYHCSIAKIIDFAASLGQKAYPGAWNDLDGLEVGNTGLTLDEQLVQFSMWALVKSPLILGNDLTKMTDTTRAIIKNKAVIDISQDPTGTPAIRLWKKEHDDGNTQLWKMSLANGTYAVAALNVSPSPKTITISFDDVFFDEYLDNEMLQDDSWNVYDLWQGVNFEKYCDTPSLETMTLAGSPYQNNLPGVSLPKNSIKLYKLTPTSSAGDMQQRAVPDFAEMKASRMLGRQASF